MKNRVYKMRLQDFFFMKEDIYMNDGGFVCKEFDRETEIFETSYLNKMIQMIG